MIPEWLIEGFLVVNVLVLILVFWTWRQALLNWKAVLKLSARRHAFRRMVRISIGLGMQIVITAVFVLLTVYPDPADRSDLVRSAIPYSLLSVTALIAAGSVYDWYEMRNVLKPSERKR